MNQCDLYRGFRSPSAIISHVVWLYFRFSLSFRDIEELMAKQVRKKILTFSALLKRPWLTPFSCRREKGRG